MKLIKGNVMLTFESIVPFEKGILFLLLSQSFAELWNSELEQKVRRYDEEAFGYPDTVGACVFITVLDGRPVGMMSWNPRQGPEICILGYNCILPECQGRGFGKAQVKEILKRLRQQGFEKVVVTTGDHPFYEPAAGMYRTCGFREIRRYPEGRDPRYGSIDFAIEIEKAFETDNTEDGCQ